jgi:CheY-like chemotaxis protein
VPILSLLKQCLLIDDDLDDQEIFCLALNDIDPSIHIVIAIDGVDALKLLNADPTFIPDTIFIDLNMPRMDGLECLREIKKLTHLKDVKIIMYTTSSENKLVSKSKEMGADAFIIKPSSLTLLTERLKVVLHDNSVLPS